MWLIPERQLWRYLFVQLIHYFLRDPLGLSCVLGAVCHRYNVDTPSRGDRGIRKAGQEPRVYIPVTVTSENGRERKQGREGPGVWFGWSAQQRTKEEEVRRRVRWRKKHRGRGIPAVFGGCAR